MHRNATRLALLSTAALGLTGLAAPIQAQALNPAVDVCTGLSLDRSLVTDVVGDVVGPVATPIEARFNQLLGLTVNVGGLAVVAPLDLDLTGVLANAAQGGPLAVQALDTDGNVVAPGNCNLQADSYALATPAGLAIGGNRITGLGTGGAVASAAEPDAIALGNNAIAGPGATGAIALGQGARANAAGSVALGAGSVADRGAQTGYGALGLAGPQASAGAVSIGSPGAERQLTNLAPGSAATDAATVGQVEGALAAANALAVQYDGPARDRITLNAGPGATGGTVIAGVAPGAVAPGSTEAVNGGQLAATNTAVAGNAAGIAANAGLGAANTAAIGALDGRVDANADGVAANGAAIGALDGRVAGNTSAIGALDGRVAGNTAAIGALDGRVTATAGIAAGNTAAIGALDGRVAANAAGVAALDGRVAGNTTAIGALDGRVAGNTAAVGALDGRVSANAAGVAALDRRTGSVEGGLADLAGSVTQIDARVTRNGDALTTLQRSVDAVPVRYTDGATPSAVATGTAAFVAADGGAVRVTNVAAGVVADGSSDAVNGSQLAATDAAVARNTGSIAAIGRDLQAIAAPAIRYTTAATPTTVAGGSISNDAMLVGANGDAPVTLHNVAAGNAPDDAANVGQLRSGLAAVGRDAIAYTDLMLAAVDFDLGELRQDSFAGSAGAMAMAGLPQVLEPGATMVAGGVGHYRGETAFAIGASRALGEGRTVLRVNGSVDTRGYAGVSAGAGFSF